MEVVNDIKHIIKSFNENRLSHAFLIETNNFENCLKDIKKIIKIINCEEKYIDNCNICNLCYQIDKETLPSLAIIRPDGINIKKDQIINLKEKMITKPIYSKYNTYVIVNAEKLNNSSANTMLKFIEEPEEKIIGFFITNNIENIIDTVKSRCQLIYQYYDLNSEKLDNDKTNLIDEYLKNIELDYRHALLYNKNIFLEKNYSREEIIEIFLKIFEIYEKIYINENNILKKYPYLANQSTTEIIKKLKIINRIIENLNKNGNINLILDSFVIEMRQLV